MAELGNTLSRARRARGITIEDAERDTHVSKRYLQALESEDFSLFPAPVYARGFLRTYSRYLGLNPDELVRVFPNGDLTVDIKPLPTVVRPQQQLISVNWIVAGLVALFLVGAGLLLLRSGNDNPVIETARSQDNTPGAGAPASPSSGGSVSAPVTSAPATVQGKAIAPNRPGQLPDFVGADKASALAVLSDNQMSYVIVEFPNRQTPKGIVISQTPSAGAKTGSDGSITLFVSSGNQ